MKIINIELKVKPNILFFDFKGQIAASLVKYFPEWQTSGVNIVLFNKAEKRGCILEHNRVVIRTENSKNEEEFFIQATEIIRTYLNKSQLESIERLGIRYIQLKNLPFHYNEITALFSNKFYSKDKQIS